MTDIPEYLNKATLFERFGAYRQSEDFKQDFEKAKEFDRTISELFDEPAAPDSEIMDKVIREKLRQFEAYDECEQYGHEQELAEHDDGSSEYYCGRCDTTMEMAGG